MSFRGVPYEDIELKTDFPQQVVRLICDSCGKEFPTHTFEVPFSALANEYKNHVTYSHNRFPPKPGCDVMYSLSVGKHLQCTRDEKGHDGDHTFNFRVDSDGSLV